MNWSDKPIAEIQDMLPNRIKSYSEHKSRRMEEAMYDKVPEIEPKTLNELQHEVYDAIDYAKTKIEDITLFETLNTLSDTWDTLKDELLIMSIALVSLKHREKEEIEKFLTVVRANGV